MPRLSRWFIRTGLLYLLGSLVVGIVGLALNWPTSIFWPAYVHLLVLGWLTQLIFGVASWMFPRPVVRARWSETLGWATYWFLNSGLLLRVAADLGRAGNRQSDTVLLVAAVLQFSAAALFVVNTWPRVRGR